MAICLQYLVTHNLFYSRVYYMFRGSTVCHADARSVSGVIWVPIPLNNTCVTSPQQPQIRLWNFLCNKSNDVHFRLGQEMLRSSPIAKTHTFLLFVLLFHKVFTKTRRETLMWRTRRMCKFIWGLFSVDPLFAICAQCTFNTQYDYCDYYS